jgi:CRP-like cAMP-binding protein
MDKVYSELDENGKLKNHLLSALPAKEYQYLLSGLELASLSAGQVLHSPGEPIEYVYFPNNAIICLVTTMENGSTVESGVVGNEGVVGTAAFMGSDIAYNAAIVQIAGEAMKIPAVRLKAEFHRGQTLQNLLLRYMQALFIQVSQGAVCNRLHTIEERFARWLLMISDRMQSKELLLTQEFISHMLGIRRSGVTVAAGTLQQAGLISYRRGKITILDRESLESSACECYRIIKAEFQRLLGVERG